MPFRKAGIDTMKRIQTTTVAQQAARIGDIDDLVGLYHVTVLTALAKAHFNWIDDALKLTGIELPGQDLRPLEAGEEETLMALEAVGVKIHLNV
jgi:hypothetical protein